MAPKSPLVVLLLVFFIAKMGSPVDGNNVEAPVYPPMSVDGPIYAPIYSPDAPADAPTRPYIYGLGKACVAMCVVQCFPISPRRRCMKTCTACCAKNLCVPAFSPCCVWDSIVDVRGNKFQCPR